MSMYIGEALTGDGNEIAHIDLLIGSKDGPVGVAFANALARQSEGHSNLLAVLAPNLAVEVVSPSDRNREVLDKVEDWQRAGTRLVWVIYPSTRSATVYRTLGDSEQLSGDDILDGGDVLPGFACNLADLFS